jgi:hypothetical protein
MIYTDKYLNIFTLSLRGVAEAIPAFVLIFILNHVVSALIVRLSSRRSLRPIAVFGLTA